MSISPYTCVVLSSTLLVCVRGWSLLIIGALSDICDYNKSVCAEYLFIHTFYTDLLKQCTYAQNGLTDLCTWFALIEGVRPMYRGNYCDCLNFIKFVISNTSAKFKASRCYGSIYFLSSYLLLWIQ